MTGSFTHKDIEDALSALSLYKRPTEYDESGKPCYSFMFHGTKEEYENLKKELIQI